MANYTMKAPCGATVSAPTQTELGWAYSAHVSSCPTTECKKASGR